MRIQVTSNGLCGGKVQAARAKLLEKHLEIIEAFRKSLTQERTVALPEDEYEDEYNADEEIEKHEKDMMKFIDGERREFSEDVFYRLDLDESLP